MVQYTSDKNHTTIDVKVNRNGTYTITGPTGKTTTVSKTAFDSMINVGNYMINVGNYKEGGKRRRTKRVRKSYRKKSYRRKTNRRR